MKRPLIDILSGLGFGFLWFFVDKMSKKYGFPMGYGFPTVSCSSPKSRKMSTFYWDKGTDL